MIWCAISSRNNLTILLTDWWIQVNSKNIQKHMSGEGPKLVSPGQNRMLAHQGLSLWNSKCSDLLFCGVLTQVMNQWQWWKCVSMQYVYVIWFDMIWFMIWFDSDMRYDMIWLWYDMIWYDMIWYVTCDMWHVMFSQRKLTVWFDPEVNEFWWTEYACRQLRRRKATCYVDPSPI